MTTEQSVCSDALVRGVGRANAMSRRRRASAAVSMTLVAVALLATAAPGDPPPAAFDEHMEWVGDGTWSGNQWSEYGEMQLMGGRANEPLGSGAASSAGARPLFGGRGGETSTVDQWLTGENHWEIYSLTFDQFREWDADEGVFQVEAALQYTLDGNALYLGAGGITNISGTTQIIENDIWLWDDTEIQGGGSGLELRGELIDTSRGKQSGEVKNLTVSGQVENWARIIGGGDVTFHDGFSLEQHADITGGDVTFEEGSAEVHADILGDGDVTVSDAQLHMHGAIRGDGNVRFDNGAEVHLHSASTYTGQTTIQQTDPGSDNTVLVFVGDEQAFGQTDGSIRVIGAMLLGSYSEDIVLGYDFRVQDGPDAGRIRFGVTDDNHLVQLAGVIDMDNSDTTFFMEHGAEAHLHDTSEIRLGDATLNIDGLGDSQIRIDGRIRGGEVGQDALVYDSLGTLILTGQNDYQGDTRLQEGDVRFSGDKAFGASENLYLEDGLNSLGSVADGPEASTSIAVHLDTNLDLVPVGDLRFEGDWRVLNSQRRLTIDQAPGQGRVVFDEEAEIDLNGSGLTFAGVGTAIVDAAIVGDGTLIKAGSGTLRLSGENTYDGETLLRGGTVEITGDSPFGVGGPVRVENSASLRALDELSIDQSVELEANLTLVQGAALTFAGDDMTIDDDVVLRLNTTNATTVESTVTLDNSLSLEGNGDLIIQGQVTGDDGIVHRGGGILTLTSANDYTGGTVLTSGTTRVGDDDALGTGTLRLEGQADLGADAAVTLANDVNLLGHLRVVEGEAIDFAGTITAASHVDPQITIANNETNTITAAGELVLSDDLTLQVAGASQLTILGQISGGGDLVSTGTGTVAVGGAPQDYNRTILQAGQFHVLDGADVTTSALTASGTASTTVLEQAELTVTNLLSLADNSSLRLDDDAQLNADRIELAGSSVLEIGPGASGDVAGSAQLTDQSTLRLFDGASLDLEDITVDGATLRLDAGATLTPQEQLSLSGGGTAMLAGSVDGLIEVNQGTLQFDGDEALANTTQVNIDGPTSIRASTAVSVDAGTTLRLRSTLTLAPGSALTLDGPELLVDQAATLAVTNPAATTLGPDTVVTLDNPLTLDLGQDLDVEGSFTGSGALTVTGAGTLRVHSDTSSVDNAFVNDGTLHLLAGGGLDLDALTVNAGTLRLDAGATIAPQNPVVLNDDGTLELAGSVDGVIQINRGTLRLDADTALADTTEVHVDGPTSLVASTDLTIDAPTTLRLRDTLTLADGGALSLDGPTLLVDQPATLAVENTQATTLGSNTTVTLDDTLTFDLSEDLDVDGRLTGAAGFVKTGAGTLRINSDDSDPGQATIAQGLMHLTSGGALSADELHVAGGAIQLDAGSSLAIGSDVRIADGRFDLNPTATFSANHVIVEQGGVLRGPGGVQAPVTVSNGGELRAVADDSQAFTTIHVDGDLTLGDGSRTVIRFDASGASDSVAVTGDSVIESGARLVMDQTDSPATLTAGLRLPVMTAADFDVDPDTIVLEIDIDTLLRFSIEVEDNPTLAVVTSQDLFAFHALGRNNRQIAEALDEIAGQQQALAPEDRDAEMEQMLDELDPQAHDDEAFNAALEAISPVLYTGIGESQLQSYRAFHHNLHRAARMAQSSREHFGVAKLPNSAPRLAQGFDERGWSDRYRTDQAPALDVPDTVPDRRFNAFVTGHGVYDRLSSQDDRPGVRSNSHGFIVGSDYALSHELAVGLSAGYTRSSLNFRGGHGSGRIHSLRVGPYARYEHRQWAVDTSLSYGYHDTNVNTTRSIGSINDRKRATYDAHDLSAHLSASYAFEVIDDQLTLSPLAAVDYTWYHRESYTERGSHTASNIRADSDTTQAAQSTLGLGVSVPAPRAMLQPEGFVGWSYQFLDDRPEVQGQFVGHDPTFTVRGPQADRHALVVGAGLVAHWNEQLATYVHYNGRFQSNEDTQAISAGLNWRF